MPRFAANLSLLYPEMPFLHRFEAAANDGFEAVECQFPYAHRPEEIAARLHGNGLQLVLINTPPGPPDVGDADAAWQRGWRGLAALPGAEGAFRAAFERALRYADLLGCPRIHAMAGVAGETVAPASRLASTPTSPDAPPMPDAARDVFQRNLHWAAGVAARTGAGIEVLIEPINRRDVPGYLLTRQADAHAVVEDIGAPNLKVQMDLYHCQVSEGDVATKLRHYLPTGRVGHLQIAGVPARCEPDGGELHYAHLFALIDQLAEGSGWRGWVGCEYKPREGDAPGGTTRGLAWRGKLLPAQ